jgi:hypothetical protein
MQLAEEFLQSWLEMHGRIFSGLVMCMWGLYTYFLSGTPK